MILSAGPNEVSNLNTSTEYSMNINEWRNKVANSSEKLYDLAEWSLNAFPSLEKVIIVKRPPRYDDRIKAELSEYANYALDDIWKRRGANKNIVIAKQDLECDGLLRVQRYGNPTYHNYDGVHMRGKMAVQHMTRSFIQMLTNIFPHLKTHVNQNQHTANSTNGFKDSFGNIYQQDFHNRQYSEVLQERVHSGNF